MSPSESRPPELGLIGNPENRRIRDFSDALVRLGRPRPSCLSFCQLLTDPRALQRWDVNLVRIDSPGENDEVTRRLIGLGGGPVGHSLEFGEIAYLREYHSGFGQVLERIERSGLPCLNSPSEIAVMFDKWECHQRFVAQSVARPPAFLAPPTWPELWAYMQGERRHGRLFLKPLHGSSASGVCALRWTPQRLQLIAPLTVRGGKLINSLRVRRYHDAAEIEAIVGPLLAQGMIAEHWIPKLSTQGGVVDLRVLVLAGTARHRVVRQSIHPMTNLHLGAQRGDEKALRAFLGPRRWQNALRLAERAAACFQRSLYAGVDILLDTSGRAWVGEINAFGDLLPNLHHQGESAYTAIARESASRYLSGHSEIPSVGAAGPPDRRACAL